MHAINIFRCITQNFIHLGLSADSSLGRSWTHLELFLKKLQSLRKNFLTLRGVFYLTDWGKKFFYSSIVSKWIKVEFCKRLDSRQRGKSLTKFGERPTKWRSSLDEMVRPDHYLFRSSCHSLVRSTTKWWCRKGGKDPFGWHGIQVNWARNILSCQL